MRKEGRGRRGEGLIVRGTEGHVLNTVLLYTVGILSYLVVLVFMTQ